MDANMSRLNASESSLDATIARLAVHQHGAFTRAQARGLGFSDRQIRHRHDSGRWGVLLPQVYEILGGQRGARQGAMAAALWAGQTSVVSHATAGVLWAFEGIRSSRVEVWTPRNIRSDLVVVHRGTRIDRADRTLIDRIPVTTPVRTLIDIAPRLEDLPLSALLESTIRSGLVDPARLGARLETLRASGRPGAGRLADILERRGAGAAMESTLEVLVWSVIEAADVPRPNRQYWVTTPGGRYRLDFCWPAVKVAVECDGFGPHAATRELFGKDRERYAELVALGFRILPVTWSVARYAPERVRRWLRDTLRCAA